MAFLAIPLVLSLLFVLIWGWVKLINLIFNPIIKGLEGFSKKQRPKIQDNPYYKMHRIKSQNEKWYDEYLKWMDKNDPGIPVDKFKFPEDISFEDEIRATGRRKPKHK